MAEGNSSHYQVLRVSVTATDKEIKQAYRKAARKAHPDHGGDAEIFRRVTLAYETLIDPRRRAEYDRRYAANTPAPGRSGAAAYEGPASGSATSAGVRRPQSPRNTAGDAPVYVSAFDDPNEVPLISRAEAVQQVHGMPRRRGIFGAEARIQRETRTVQLISKQVLSAIPAARLINGLRSPSDNNHIDHAVLSGYRLALVGSMLLPKGAYAWDGQSLRHGGRSIAPPQLAHIVRHMQDLFPELNVTGWVVLHSPDGNLHEPVIDHYGKSRSGGGVEIVNGAGLARGLKQFLSSGPAPNTVVVPVLARLLRGMH
ncbi:J domain-containing protein [Paenarthrobacter ureafaciens]|uniref:J domain-containing protein n=1 Tax=Paenarthrobacter ureafaciens TaxID=37931 RepID=UPI001917519B|nr:J domain-containing protein [Paenarthrobacter ureafaciens]QQQ61304.1 J domain-containing protein [Paenarthrobacter ureafaciens]